MFSCFRKKKKKLKGQPPIDRRLVEAQKDQNNHTHKVYLHYHNLGL